MGVCTRLSQRKYCQTMKGGLLALALFLVLWTTMASGTPERNDLNNFEINANFLSRTIRDAKQGESKIRRNKSGKKGKARGKKKKKKKTGKKGKTRGKKKKKKKS